MTTRKIQDNFIIYSLLVIYFTGAVVAAVSTSPDSDSETSDYSSSDPEIFLSNLLATARKSPESICHLYKKNSFFPRGLAEVAGQREIFTGFTKDGTTSKKWGWTELIENEDGANCALYVHLDRKSCGTALPYRWPSARVQRELSLRSSYHVISAWDGNNLANGFAFLSDSKAWVTFGWLSTNDQECDKQAELAINLKSQWR